MSKFLSLAAVLALGACHHDSDNHATTTPAYSPASTAPIRHRPTTTASTATEQGKTYGESEVGVSGQASTTGVTGATANPTTSGGLGGEEGQIPRQTSGTLASGDQGTNVGVHAGVEGRIPSESSGTLASGGVSTSTTNSNSTNTSTNGNDTMMVDPGASSAEPADSAVAVLAPTKGSKVSGTILFHQTSDGLEMTAQFKGLSKGTHAFHVHQYGDCSSADGKSAGEHFNFNGSSMHPEQQMITGDLGEVTAKSDGTATLTKKIPDASLQGKYTIIGRAIVIHDKGDDETKPPDGNAGKRLACGVIGVAAVGGASTGSEKLKNETPNVTEEGSPAEEKNESPAEERAEHSMSGKHHKKHKMTTKKGELGTTPAPTTNSTGAGSGSSSSSSTGGY